MFARLKGGIGSMSARVFQVELPIGIIVNSICPNKAFAKQEANLLSFEVSNNS
jgi:hypothetical protein